MTRLNDECQSPVEPTDYAGLQLDTRPKGERDRDASMFKPGLIVQPYRSTWRSEKLVYGIAADDDPNSTWRQNGYLYPPMYRTKEELPARSLPPRPEPTRSCHSMKRLIMIIGFLMAVIITGAVLGGILGSRRILNTSSATATPSVSPSIINAGLP